MAPFFPNLGTRKRQWWASRTDRFSSSERDPAGFEKEAVGSPQPVPISGTAERRYNFICIPKQSARGRNLLSPRPILRLYFAHNYLSGDSTPQIQGAGVYGD